MNITVFGATGQAGIEIIKQALWRKHHVTAFGRNVYDLKMEDEHLRLFKGALFDEKEVLQAITGADAVLSSIGGAFDGSDKTRSLGIKNIITQMKKAGVQRIIAIGGMGILNASDDTLIIDTPSYPAEFIPVGNEHRKAYEYLKDSDLNWTFVCSPDIINEGPTGNYITSKDYPPQPNKFKINAGDLARFMLNELEKNEYVKAKVGISAA
ncbi:MAG: SDR family oxidoreductase [Chitinophagaceae bacterium]|nr:SDR family oxidoreductase [Chitinophagaceae bacterium]